MKHQTDVFLRGDAIDFSHLLVINNKSAQLSIHQDEFCLIVGKTIGLCVRVYNEYDALLGIIADVVGFFLFV